jgi:hypothetical protein
MELLNIARVIGTPSLAICEPEQPVHGFDCNVVFENSSVNFVTGSYQYKNASHLTV